METGDINTRQSGKRGESIEVSVICPSRNEEIYIRDCMRSLLEQTYPLEKMEILVVDGMSDDATRDIVQSISKQQKNVRLLDNHNKTVPFAMNIGIRSAKGKYILRMDGHAKVAPDYVQHCVAILEKGEVDCVGGPIISVNESKEGKAIAAAMSSPFGVGDAKFRTSNEECFVDSVAFPAFRKEIFDKIGLFDEELSKCQDDELNFRLRRFGGTILLYPKIKSWYYPRSSLKKLWRQYYGYGFWKIRVFQKNPLQMKLRHFVPAGFVLTLFICLLLGLATNNFFFASALPLVYFAVSVLCSIKAQSKNRDASIHGILISFFILHFGYGIGFLHGLIRFFPRWFNSKDTSTPIASAN